MITHNPKTSIIKCILFLGSFFGGLYLMKGYDYFAKLDVISTVQNGPVFVAAGDNAACIAD